MRISTSTIFQNGINNIQGLTSSLQTLNMQIDTQKRVVTPADDPVASARIESLTVSSNQNQQFLDNSKAVTTWLSLSETAVKSATDLMGAMKSLAIQAGNGSYDTPQLQALQKQLGEAITELAGYANATDGNGNYLFSGNKVDTAPFTVNLSSNPPTTTYNGDTSQRSVQVSSSANMVISDPGSAVFGQPGGSPTAAFDALTGLYSLLGQNPKPANFAAQLNTSINAITAASTQMSTATASIGSRGAANDNMQSMASSLKLQYSTSVGNLQDLDMAQAISDFTLTQTSLKYSQLTYSQVTKLSLFNYLG
ncbi:flagellar hook-associated protein 3 [Xenophilus sp. AP218F]|nr:flagellar hook-associated protein 3 [Xenophilus sp. AP218F]